MKAIVYEKYGLPEVLELKEVDRPEPGDGEILVKVHAASVNSWDWDRLTGEPKLYRLISGIRKPKLKILGADIAGTVESVGKNVKNFKPGDEVFGDLSDGKWGGFAEYAIARENELAIKSTSMSFEQAAALPQAGVMAFQALHDMKTIQSGDRVLMNGAAGGVGTILIQLAKNLGAHVTAVDSGEKLDFLKTLGADELIDYQKENFIKNRQQYDLIVDVVADRTLSEYQQSLNPKGIMVAVGGKISNLLKIALYSSIVLKEGKKIRILSQKPNKYLGELKELFEKNKVKPVIDKIFPLHQTAEALQYIGDGKVRGKLIIRI